MKILLTRVSISFLAVFSALVLSAPARAERFTDLVAITKNPPEALRKLGFKVEKDNKYQHRIVAPFIDAQGHTVTISSGEAGTDISAISVTAGGQVEVTYANGVIDNFVIDEKAGTYKLVTQKADKTVLPAEKGRVLRDQNCKLGAGKLQVADLNFPFATESLGRLGDPNAEFKHLFAAGICAPLDCEYDATQKQTLAGGVALSEAMAFQSHAIGNYAAWQRMGVCKRADMKCSFTTVPDSKKIHVSALGVAVGTPIEDWQGFGDQVREARENYGCTFSQTRCSLSTGGLNDISAHFTGSVTAMGLRIGNATIPASLPSAPGTAASNDIGGVLSQLGRLQGVCQVECTHRQTEKNTIVTFNGEKQTFPRATIRPPVGLSSLSCPAETTVVTDQRRKNIKSEGGSSSSGPHAAEPHGAGSARE